MPFCTIVYILCIYIGSLYATPTISYKLNGGRLGDNIVNYCNARWIAHTHKLPFYANPFPFWQHFMIAQHEPILPSNIPGAMIHHPKQIFGYTSTNTCLYIAYQKNVSMQLFEYMIQDSTYRTIIRSSFKSSLQPSVVPPASTLGIAVHIRRGGGFDPGLAHGNQSAASSSKKHADQLWPLKFPPLEYYLAALRIVCAVLPQEITLYVYIFTDDKNPASLANRFKQEFRHKENITFHYREHGNHHAKNVVEDLLALATFPILIRSGSNYGVAAQLIGDHRMVVYPNDFHWEDPITLKIDNMAMLYRTKDNCYMRRIIHQDIS